VETWHPAGNAARAVSLSVTVERDTAFAAAGGGINSPHGRPDYPSRGRGATPPDVHWQR
jgi:hypothetical protein